MRIFTKLIFLLEFILFSQIAVSQGKGIISGEVFDSKTKEALIGVGVKLLESSQGAFTDEFGKFVITNLKPSTYRLEISYVGYESQVLTDVIVKSVSPANVRVELSQSNILTDEVTITAGYFTQKSEEPVSSTSLSREEIRRLPGGFEDVVRAVTNVPGVASANVGGRNDLLVRGGGPTENLYLINNFEVPNINHFGNQGSGSGSLSFVYLDFVKKVDFSTGGFGVRYGDKMSSVLSIKMRSGRNDRIGGKATVSASQYGFELEGPISKKGNFVFSARRSYLDLIFKAIDASFVPVFTDFNFVAEYKISPRNTLFFLGLAAIDRIDKNQSDLENRVENAGILDNSQIQLISGVSFRRLIGNGFLDFTFNHNLNNFDFSQANENLEKYFQSDAKEREYNFKFDSYYKIKKQTGIYAGSSLKFISNFNQTTFADTIYNRSGNKIPISETGIPSKIDVETKTAKSAIYLEAEQNLFKKLNLLFGLRADFYNFLNESFYPSYRFSTNYQLTEKIRIKGSLGRYFQSPSYVWVINDFNKNLKAMKNDMTILGFDFLLRQDLNFSVEAFYKNYTDLPTGTTPETDYLVLTNTDAGYGGRDNDFQSFGYFPLVSEAKGEAFGLEFLLQKKFSQIPIYGQMSLSFSKSEYTAGNRIKYPGEYDQRMIFNISGGYKPNPKWEFSSKFRLNTGATFTPIYLPSKNNGELQNLPEEYLNDRLGIDHSLDIRIDRRFNFTNLGIIFFLDIQNVYNNRYNVKPRYDFWNDEIEDEQTLGILPSIGLTIEF